MDPTTATAHGTAARGPALDDPDRLVAWCVVPFDGRRRDPAERVAMLRRLGFRRFAYDWRDEHLHRAAEEFRLLDEAGIALHAVWFPPRLDDGTRLLLDLLAARGAGPGEPDGAGADAVQLWTTTMYAGPELLPPDGHRRAVARHVDLLGPLADAAAAAGARLALYNHNGWFGEPEHQLEILDRLGREDVGLVYNQHHGHRHVDRFAELLGAVAPRLWCVTLNGTARGGDRSGRKILPLGHGHLDRVLIGRLVESGYAGPLALLGHTDDDAELRLAENLDGVRWLERVLRGEGAGPPPRPRVARWRESGLL